MSEAERSFEDDVLLGFDAGWKAEVIDVIEGIEEADFVDTAFDEFLQSLFDEVFIVMSESEGIGATEEHLELEVITEAAIFHGVADGIKNGEWVVAAVDGDLETLPASDFCPRKARFMRGRDDFRKIRRVKDPVLLGERGLLAITQREVDELGRF